MYGTFFYLASPYSKYPGGRLEAFHKACYNAALLMMVRIPVFCPIAHTHTIGAAIPRVFDTHDFWMAADKPFIQLAHGLIVLEMEGWQESEGVQFEIKCFREALKPVIPMTPGEVPSVLLEQAMRTHRVSGS